MSSRFNLIFIFFVIIFSTAFIYNINSPLQGVHSIRQADTLFSAYSYCKEDTPFLLPKLPQRGLSSGVGIGEFPLYSYIVSLPCQISGVWSEVTPKIFVLIFLFLNIWVWGIFIKNLCLNFLASNSPLWKWDWLSFILLFLFSTHTLLFYTISIPDSLSLLCIGLAGLIVQKLDPHKNNNLRIFTSVLLFVIGFGIRPYYIPLIFFITQDKKHWLFAITLSSLFYLFWYQYWVQKSTVNYYYTALMNPMEILLQWRSILQGIFEFIFRNSINLIGLFAIFFVIRKFPMARKHFSWPALLLSFSIALVVLLRGEHILNHSYYLGAAAIIMLSLLVYAFGLLSEKQRLGFLIMYGLIGIANTQHLWKAQAAEKYQTVQNLLRENQVKPEDKIAVYVGDGSCSNHYLYWAKHIGWCIYERDFKTEAPCPVGAQFYLKYENEDLMLRKCHL